MFTFFFLLVGYGKIEGHKSWKFNPRACGGKQVSAGRNADRVLVNHGRCHLRGHKTVPDEFIQRQLVFGKKSCDLFRGKFHGRGSNGLVGILGLFPIFKEAGLVRTVFRSKALFDQ